MTAPAAAEKLHKTAQEHGWWSKVVTTEGHKLGKSDEPLTCTTVRLTRPGRTVLAIWLDGKFRCGVQDGRKLNSAELKAVVTS